MRSDQERLIDIQQAIFRIEKYAIRGQDVFNEIDDYGITETKCTYIN